jgi:hypothetical protein
MRAGMFIGSVEDGTRDLDRERAREVPWPLGSNVFEERGGSLAFVIGETGRELNLLLSRPKGRAALRKASALSRAGSWLGDMLGDASGDTIRDPGFPPEERADFEFERW